MSTDPAAVATALPAPTLPVRVTAAICGFVISGSTSLLGSSQASSAAKQASDNSLAMYEQTRSDLSPYTTTGQGVLGDLSSVATSGLTGGGPDYVTQASQNLPGQMTQAELEKTPGYQFNLSQGLKATQAAAAAKGLGVSGAALKGAATYATGLADSTYQNQFNNAQQRFSDYLSLNTSQQGNLLNQFNRLYNTASLGENAAAQTGTTGASLNNASSNALISAGQSAGAGTVSAGNALSNAANNYAGYNYWAGQSGGTSGYGGPSQGTLNSIASAASGAGASGNAYVDPATGLTNLY